MLAFVTVGSTRFDELVATALSSALQDALSRKGYTDIIIQRGNSPDPPRQRTDGVGSVQVEIWQFKPSLQSYYERADLVISHAGETLFPPPAFHVQNAQTGSGTILEVLRLGKPLIVVPNPTLMHNHQEELASALESLGHLKTATVKQAPPPHYCFASAKLFSVPWTKSLKALSSRRSCRFHHKTEAGFGLCWTKRWGSEQRSLRPSSLVY
jgi:beta-1,4-N-acetylglucosaminyltransferase